MKICEDCIKKDVCKYQAKVEKFESDTKLPEPLESGISCKYKRTKSCNWTYNEPTYTWHEPGNTRLEAGS